MLGIPPSDFLIASHRSVCFCGWSFAYCDGMTPSGGLYVVLMSYHRLLNPEEPTLIHSYWTRELPGSPGAEIPDYVIDGLLREGCAWLIAHWWSHALDICECQTGRESGFREALTVELLRLNPELVCGSRVRRALRSQGRSIQSEKGTASASRMPSKTDQATFLSYPVGLPSAL